MRARNSGTAGSRSSASCTSGRRDVGRLLGVLLGDAVEEGDGLGGEQRDLLLLHEHGELRRLLAGLEVEGALAGLADGAGAEGVDGVELDLLTLMIGSSAFPSLARRRRSGSGGRSSSRVPVSLHFTSATPCAESERGDRRRRHDDALEQVEVHAGVVRDRGLDRVGVRHDHDQLARVVGHHRFERGDHARLHLRDRLAAREPGARRRALHHLPEVGLGEVGELAAGPLAVVGLEHAVERAHLEAVVARRWPRPSAWCARSGSRRPPRSAGRRAARRAPRPAPARRRRGRCRARGRTAAGRSAAVTAWRTRISVVASARRLPRRGRRRASSLVASSAARRWSPSGYRRLATGPAPRSGRPRWPTSTRSTSTVGHRPRRCSTPEPAECDRGARGRARGTDRHADATRSPPSSPAWPRVPRRVGPARRARPRRRRGLRVLPRRLPPRARPAAPVGLARLGLRAVAARDEPRVPARRSTGSPAPPPRIGEADEAQRCAEFLHQLDPAWDEIPPERGATSTVSPR